MTTMTRQDLDLLPDYSLVPRLPGGAVNLASNEVAIAPVPAVVEAIAKASVDANRYPELGGESLAERLAERQRVPAGWVAVGAGSGMLCQHLMQAVCRGADEIVFGWRSFEAYPVMAQVVGARPVPVPLTPRGELDLDAMAAAITPATRLVIVCNPNNPTGALIPPDRLRAFLEQVPDHVVVAVDEAYREFAPDTTDDAITLVRAHAFPNLVVLRTFSKAYGLAGLRVGYCVGPSAVLTALCKVRLPFTVNRLGQAAALAALDVVAEIAARCREVVSQRDRLRGSLLAAGYGVPPSHGNFLWLPLGADAAAFRGHCLDHKIVVAAFQGDGVRVTAGTADDNEAFLAAAVAFARFRSDPV